MKKKPGKVWRMPKWMEPYRELIADTGGNEIEELMNDHETNGQNNVIRAALICCVNSQTVLLRRLAYHGHLVGVPKGTDSRL